MEREAIVVPGARYGPHTPLLMFAADAAEARAAHLRHVYWDPPYDPDVTPLHAAGPWVAARLPAVAGRPLMIGKSLGTYAAGHAAEHALPAVWLTPLLTVDGVVDVLRRATAPALLVGGTADKFWDGGLARELSPHVLEVDGADHGMYVPGPLANSAAVLGTIVTAIEGFLDDVVWPAR